MDSSINKELFKPDVYMKCICCGSSFSPDPWRFFCPKCGCLLHPVLTATINVGWSEFRKRRIGVWRYRELLPLSSKLEPVSLDEGGTPLIRLRSTGVGEAYIKFEGTNPTGSFKDRGMTIGVTIAKHIGVKGVIVASTGNTAASAAAYTARAGLSCVILLPKGRVALGKLAQALLHGAQVKEVEGSFDNALDEVLNEYVKKGQKELYPLNSYNPWRLEGQKTIAYEIVDELGFVPDVVIVPVGNAGNISAIWKGFDELYELGLANKKPRMIGVQAEGASPLVRTWMEKSKELLVVNNPETIATAIRIGRPVNWMKALKAVYESNGAFISVSDDEILEAMKNLAMLEGIGVEPASAASLAGYKKALGIGIVDKGETVVLIGTGHALKDPDTILRIANWKTK